MIGSTSQPDGWDYALLIGGILGVFIGLAGAIGLAGVALTGLIRGNYEAALTGEWSASATLTMALLCLPAVFYGGGSVLGRDTRSTGKPNRRLLYLALLFPAAMVTGHLAYERGVVAGLIGPISHLLAAGLPVLVAVVLVRRLGPELPKRRAWGQFLAGLWITPAGALTLELLALIPAAAALIVALRSSIDFRSLGNLMIGPDSLNSPEYSSLLQSLILKPWVIVIIVGYVAVMVPIIEETLKSIAVWPFLRRGMTPAEAFLSGTLAGAGYALFEAMFLTQPGQGWAETMLARVGASFVHVLTAGLSSWGLVQGFHYRRWERCILAALAAVMIHGLWNASAIGIGISSVAQEVGLTTIPAGIWPLIGEIGAVLLALIGGMALVAPIAIARRLGRTDSETASQTSAIP